MLRHAGVPDATSIHLPDTDLDAGTVSNISSNIALVIESTGFVEGLVRLETEAAGDDFLLDLGGAAEDPLHPAIEPGAADHVIANLTHPPCSGTKWPVTRLHRSVPHRLTIGVYPYSRVDPLSHYYK